MSRYTFDEIREFKVGDVFWANNDKFTVCEVPKYNHSDFYGDCAEMLEWGAMAESSQHYTTFQISNVRGQGNAADPVIYKNPTFLKKS